MALAFALSPLLVVALGALLLMLAEAFSSRASAGRDSGPRPRRTRSSSSPARRSRRAVWMFGVERHRRASAASRRGSSSTASRSSSTCVLCLGGALAALLAGGYLPEHNLERGEFYSLLLFSTFGAMMLAAAGDALTLFLGLETMSHRRLRDDRLPPRVARARPRGRSSTSSSARSRRRSSSTASRSSTARPATPTSPGSARRVKARRGAEPDASSSALALVLVGLVFKVSAVPFHMWTPDAYEGAPTPATTFMAVAVKSGRASRCCSACSLAALRRSASSTSWASGLAAGRRVARGAHDDGREPRRRPAGVGQAHARVLEHRARRATCSSACRRRCARSAEAGGERPLLPARLHGLDGGRVRRAHPLRQPRQARR